MSMTQILSKICNDFEISGEVDQIWNGVPGLIAELRSEFEARLQVSPQVSGISLILAKLEPQLAYGTNSIIFDLHFPLYRGLNIRCECCLEHPNAKVSVLNSPEDEAGKGAEVARFIIRNYVGNTFETNLLRIQLTRT